MFFGQLLHEDLDLLSAFAQRDEPRTIDSPAEREMLGRYRDAFEDAAHRIAKRSLFFIRIRMNRRSTFNYTGSRFRGLDTSVTREYHPPTEFRPHSG